LNCPQGQQHIVLQKWRQYSQALVPFNLSITSLTLNSRGSWQMVLNNGISITLGRTDPDTRFARFITAYPTVLAQQTLNIRSIDLRYSDGFAVAWKKSINVHQ